MKKLLLIILFLPFLYSCESSSVYKGREAYKKYFYEILKDPNSMEIYNEEVISNDKVSATFVIDMGAKNGYGGMMRKKYTIKTIGNIVAKVLEYDIRYASSESKHSEMQEDKAIKKLLNFTYKGKMVPVAGFEDKKYIGKMLILQDSCLYVHFSPRMNDIIKASKEKDADRVFELGGILPEGEQIKIISSKENVFEIESPSLYGIKVYIEWGSIF